MNDMAGFVFTPNGEEDTIDSMDGSGISDALEARFESNSLLDARVGDNKKTIMMDVNRRLGKPILLKWAVYALTSRMRRDSFKSTASGELMCKKMRSKEIRLVTNIADYYNQRADKIVFQNYKNGLRYKILSVGLTPDNDPEHPKTYFRKIVQIDQNGDDHGDIITQYVNEFAPNVAQNTLYALDQMFGGA